MSALSELGFPLWVRLTHFFNFLFVTLLIRSGIEIIGAHPKFYWRDDALPGTEWLRFTKKRMPEDQLWTAEDETEEFPPWLALPGKNNLGLGRHWHYWSVAGWVLTGLIYVVLLFATDQWRRLVPTSWEIVPAAWQAFVDYAHLRIPPDGNPFNALQQLTYFTLIFLVAPLQIITGLMMAPALGASFPFFPKVFGGRQAARSLHLIGTFVFIIFIGIHLAMVVAHGLGEEFAKIVLGGGSHSHFSAMMIGALGIAAVIAFHIWGTRYSLRHPSRAKKLLEIGIDRSLRLLFHHWPSRQNYREQSAYVRVNGRPPRNETYLRLAADNFRDWKLELTGLVQTPLHFSLADLHTLPRRSQTTLHTCIQGWSYLAQWSGVPVSVLVDKCQPLSDARYLVFETLDEKWEKPGHGFYYEVIDLEIAGDAQTILAYEMNGKPLPVAHGAPLRLRTENQLGYKMAKWICGIRVVASFEDIGAGQGGWRDDVLHYYSSDAGI